MIVPGQRYDSKVKIGLNSLLGAILSPGPLTVNERGYEKARILEALSNRNTETLQEMSTYFFQSSGIYKRLCIYFAKLFCYDWFIEPRISYSSEGKVLEEKMLKDFHRALNYLDDSNIKTNFDKIALEAIKSGAYYAYVLDCGNKFVFQQLPNKYCRCRYESMGLPVVEFNVKYFDTFRNNDYRKQVLAIFPKEIQKAYQLYKEGKLKKETPSDADGWIILSVGAAFRFSFNESGNDTPLLIDVAPSILDLDDAQELDRKKTAQKLVKILIQKLPRDKNGDLIFDVDEARDLHNSVTSMVANAVGVDVLTTFADVEMVDTKDTNSQTSKDDLEKVERTVYNNVGSSANLFNTEGNLALEKSVAKDEAYARDILSQFEALLNCILLKFGKSKYTFKAHLLQTTIFNYKDKVKTYKELASLGYPRTLPWVAMGNSQSSMLSMAKFEREYLHLNEIMLPPPSSTTMSAATQAESTGSNKTGRPPLDDDQKSEKTIQNEESQS